MSLTKDQLNGKTISTGLSSIPDETWDALRRDKLRREKKKLRENENKRRKSNITEPTKH
jgi:hypothetical protein